MAGGVMMSDLQSTAGKLSKSKSETGPSIYDRLCDDSSAIRVFTIIGTDREGRICCRLHNVILDEGPEYFALSYAWRDDSARLETLINNHSFLIRNNLFEFFLQILTKSKLRRLPIWVDAVCIDQSTVKERNHQVRLMSRIYSQADTVIVWLGPCPNRQRILHTMSKYHANDTGHSSSNCRTLRLDIADILNNPYWTRTWIVQELWFARRINIRFGSQSVTWERFWSGFTYYRQHALSCVYSASWGLDGDIDQQESTVSVAEGYYYSKSGSKPLLTRQGINETHSSMKLSDLLRSYKDHDCSDLKDRIIALLSLVEGGSNFSPDYSLGMPEFAISVWLHFGRGGALLGSILQALKSKRSEFETQFKGDRDEIRNMPERLRSFRQNFVSGRRSSVGLVLKS